MNKLIFMLIFISTSATASGYYCCNGQDGIDGQDGVDGIDGIDGIDGKDGRDGENFTGNKLKRALSIGSAMAAIPGISHHGDGHQHTAVGVGVGHYSGEDGVAIGLSHMKDTMSYKLSIGVSGSEEMIGAGAGWTF